MRRRVGIGGLQRDRRIERRTAKIGEEAQESQMQHIEAQLEKFKVGVAFRACVKCRTTAHLSTPSRTIPTFHIDRT